MLPLLLPARKARLLGARRPPRPSPPLVHSPRPLLPFSPGPARLPSPKEKRMSDSMKGEVEVMGGTVIIV